MKPRVAQERIHQPRSGVPGSGPVLYWMSREQRVADNWAVLHAQDLAWQRGAPLAVVFCLAPAFPGATLRAYAFMLAGLAEVENKLARYRIPFLLLCGKPEETLPALAHRCRAGAVVTDFDPLRIKRRWREQVARRLEVPLIEVDAHNIVPCRYVSTKQEFGAYTLRPKIHRLLDQFLGDFPPLIPHPVAWLGRVLRVDWDRVRRWLKPDEGVTPVTWLTPGERAARRMLRKFVNGKLAQYHEERNDPNLDGQSHLSPYLHFGQISAQRVALEVRRAPVPEAARQAFLEELIVRRELADNFCLFNARYDHVAGFPQWARQTLAAHAGDPRPYHYGWDQLAGGETHDPLWNAAQRDLVARGKLHGYLRMYWAKKILEWTNDPAEALTMALRLNDRYELDGRDPNGYAGVAWSIGGVHDRPWPERPIFGKIRFMSYAGCRAKFDVDAYIRRVAER